MRILSALIFLVLVYSLTQCSDPNEEKQKKTIKTSQKDTIQVTCQLDFPKGTTFYFDTVYDTEKVAVKYPFKNTGTDTLFLDVRGNFPTNHPKHPIAPGEEGIIDGVLYLEGRKGSRNTNATVTFGSRSCPEWGANQMILKAVGFVLESSPKETK
jgi:hypothetical protein